jgi:hypothetical protein
MGLAAAVGAGAVASIGGSLLSANASNNALNQQKYMFQQGQQALNPYIQAGQGSLSTLQNLITPGTASQTLQSLPGLQFQQQFGNLAATNQLAAEGLGGSAGPLAKTLSDYNQGLASTYYQNAVGNLQNFANMGMNAASSLAGNAVSSGQGQANSIQQGGNALAGGVSNAGNMASNSLMLNNLLNNNNNSSIYGSTTSSLPGDPTTSPAYGNALNSYSW